MYHSDELPPYTPANEKEDTRGQVAWRSLRQPASSRLLSLVARGSKKGACNHSITNLPDKSGLEILRCFSRNSESAVNISSGCCHITETFIFAIPEVNTEREKTCL